MIIEADPLRVLHRRLRAVVFVDVVDSVRLIHHDEERTINRWRDFVATVQRDYLVARGGRLVKSQGDGLLLEFESTVQAVECALAMQALMHAAEETVSVDKQIKLRIGIHLADVIVDEIDIYGDGVNIAARLRDLGGPTEIVVSAAVREQITDGLGLTIEDIGERRLKGLPKAVRAFRVWPPGVMPVGSPLFARRIGDRPSIAVLPFRNLSGDAANDFLGEMVAENVISDLSRLTDLFVISRLSTTPFRDRQLSTRNVADALGVRYVLEGSLRVAGKRMRALAELTEAETGTVIWSEPFEGSVADIFDLLDQLSIDIAKRVVPYVRQLELQRARGKPTGDLTAYELTLRAIDCMHRSSAEDLESARLMLEAAVIADPRYVAPLAWLAHLHVRQVGQGWSGNVASDSASAIRRAEEALALDDRDPWALSVYGLVAAYLNKDLEVAIGRYEKALALNPSAAFAWLWSTTAYAWLGNGTEAVRRAPMAASLSPFDPNMYAFTSYAGVASAVAGDYGRSVDWCRLSIRQNRMFVSSHRMLSIALVLADRLGEARDAAKQLLLLEPTLTVSRFRDRYPGIGSPHGVQFCQALGEAGVPA